MLKTLMLVLPLMMFKKTMDDTDEFTDVDASVADDVDFAEHATPVPPR